MAENRPPRETNGGPPQAPPADPFPWEGGSGKPRASDPKSRKGLDPDRRPEPAEEEAGDERPWILAFGLVGAFVAAAVFVPRYLSKPQDPAPALALVAVSPPSLSPAAVPTEAPPPPAALAAPPPAAPPASGPLPGPAAPGAGPAPSAPPPASAPAPAPQQATAGAPAPPRPLSGPPPFSPAAGALAAAAPRTFPPGTPTAEPFRAPPAGRGTEAPLRSLPGPPLPAGPTAALPAPDAGALRDLAVADRQLRRAYVDAAEAGVSAEELVAAQDAWEQLKARAPAHPQDVARGYRRIVARLVQAAAARLDARLPTKGPEFSPGPLPPGA